MAAVSDTFLPAGFNHLGFGLVDDRIVKTLTGTDPRRGERAPPEEGNVVNDPEPPTVAPQPTVTYGGPGPVPRPRTDDRPPDPRCRPRPWRPW